MKAKINLLLLTLIVSMPFYAHADGFINGVKSVVRGVGQGVEDLGTGVENAAEDVGRGVGNAFNGTSEKTEENDNSDAGITARAKDAIKDLDANNQIGSGYNLNVQTSNGIVNISGTVTNAADTKTIKDKVSNLNGVKSVNTKITVKST